MKARLFIIALFGLALAACHKAVETRHGTSLQPIASPELSAIDSLMWQRPDSALTLLLSCRDAMNASPNTPDDDSLETHSMRLYNGHYYQLLLAELLYKNDSAQTNRTELLQAVGYFDSLLVGSDTRDSDTRGVSLQRRPNPRRDALRASADNATITFLDARAHYINGVGYYEMDSAVQACKEYLKALEIMEERFEEKDLVGEKARLMALTNTRLVDLFSDYYLHEQAIYFGKEAFGYYQKYDASLRHIVWLLDEIGSHHEMMGSYDSASIYYNNGLMVLSDTNNITYRDVSTHVAFLNYKMGKSPKVSLRRLKQLLQQSESLIEAVSRSAIIGGIYYHEKQFDSAWVYLNKVFKESESVNSKKQAAEWLVEICKLQGRKSEILEYAEFLAPFATQDEDKGTEKSKLAGLSNVCKNFKLEKQHKENIQNQTKIIVVAFIGFLIALSGLFVLYRRNKRKKQSLETQIKEEQYAHKIQQKALSGRLRRSNSSLKSLKIKELPDAMVKEGREEFNGGFADEVICRHILMVCNDKRNSFKSTVPVSVYANIALDDAQKAQLKKAATKHYGELFGKLKAQYPNLKEQDLFYCYLCLLGLDNTQIAVMLQRSSSTIWEREKRLQKLFDSSSKISVFLHEYMIG